MFWVVVVCLWMKNGMKRNIKCQEEYGLDIDIVPCLHVKDAEDSNRQKTTFQILQIIAMDLDSVLWLLCVAFDLQNLKCHRIQIKISKGWRKIIGSVPQ